MKIVLNGGYGGFCLSAEASRMILNRKNIPFFEEESQFGTQFYESESRNPIYPPFDIDRRDPDLVAVVEYLGEAANPSNSSLSYLYVKDIPEGTVYRLCAGKGGDEWLEFQDDLEWEVAT